MDASLLVEGPLLFHITSILVERVPSPFSITQTETVG